MVGSITKIQYALNGYLEARFPQQNGSLSKELGFGVSFYLTVWSLLERPLKDFSVGLPSTWIKPENDDVTVPLCPPGTYAREHWKNQEATFWSDYFQTIEGGAGFWANTQLPTKAPKYRILGIPKCYTPGTGIGAPGWPFGFDFDPNEPNKPNALPDQAMGLAQLSNCILVPPDGMPFAKGSEAKQLGVAWMALPLMDYDGWFHLQPKFDENKCLGWRRGNAGEDQFFSTPADEAHNQLWRLVPSGTMGGFLLENGGKYSDRASGSIVHFQNDGGSDLLMRPVGEDCYTISPRSGPAGVTLRVDGKDGVNMSQTNGRNEWRLVPRAVPGILPQFGDDVATGNSSWTVFLNSQNFKGPVAFFPPATWSRISKENIEAVGRGLDARPARMDRGAMEFAMVPGLTVQHRDGLNITTYSRIPKISFPTEQHQGKYKGKYVTPLMQDITLYSCQALYGAVMSWFDNPKGQAAPGKFAATGAKAHKFAEAAPIDFEQAAIDEQGNEKLEKEKLGGISDLVSVIDLGDGNTGAWGLLWEQNRLGLPNGQFPEYFEKKMGVSEFTAIAASDVPEETGLRKATFDPPNPVRSYHPYVSPQSGAWTSPGPTGKPQTVTLEDKTIVTYAWYKFVDQPALQNLNLTEDQKRRLQSRIELLHKNWKRTDEYMKPPSTGRESLVSMDPALIIKDPKIGYVPIVIGQVSPKQEEGA